jgi:hypothetical protein
MGMRHVVVCGLPGSALLSTISHKRLDFRKKKLKLFAFLFSLQILISTFFILRRSERDVTKEYNVIVKYVLLLSDFNKTSIF